MHIKKVIRVEGPRGGVNWEVHLPCGHVHTLLGRSGSGYGQRQPAPTKARCPTCYPPDAETTKSLHPLLVRYAAIAEHARALLLSDNASLAHLPESQQRHLEVLADLLRGLPELEERHLLGTSGFWLERPQRQPSEPDELPPDTEAAATP